LPPIRVAVADDDAVFRAALVDVIEAEPGLTVVLAASSGSGFAGLVAQARPDVVVLDVRMPDGGPGVVRSILGSAGHRPPAVVVVSADSAPHTVRAMVQAGARGYLVKGRIGSSLPDLLTRIAGGEVVLAVPGAAELRSGLAEADTDGTAGHRDGAA
jgi:DNA-binding NarL/FixJ family response regulator